MGGLYLNKMERKLDIPDSRIMEKLAYLEASVPDFKRRLNHEKLDSVDDPTEVSIIPRIISSGEREELYRLSRDIVSASFKALDSFLEDPSRVRSSPMNDFVLGLPFDQNRFSGVGRLDFLKEGDDYKLIENNFVYIGSWRYIVETNRIWSEMFGDEVGRFGSASPVDSAKKKVQERGVENVLLLCKDEIVGAPWFLRREFSPLETGIITEEEYDLLRIGGSGKLEFKGREYDSVYPRAFSGSKGMEDDLVKYQDVVRRILGSRSFVFDSWQTILIEDKDLRFLLDADPSLEGYLPETLDVEDVWGEDLSRYVLKRRDLHSGRGISMSPRSVDGVDNAVIQEKVNANRYPVLTNYGHQGDAIYDTGVHVAYTFNRETKELEEFELAGVLSRFSLDGEIVNMCQGGGMIPTFEEDA